MGLASDRNGDVNRWGITWKYFLSKALAENGVGSAKIASGSS